MANNVFAEFGPQLANPFAEYGPKLEQPSVPVSKPEKTGVLRAAADIPVQVGRGVAVGVKALSDVFGADNPVSRAASGVEDFLGGLLSAQAKNDQAEIARIMKEAQDKGVGDQVTAAVKAFATAPVDMLSQALGTAVPVIAGGLAGSVARLGAMGIGAVGTGVGAAMGAGTVKGQIYDAVKQELIANKVPEAEAEKRAQEAQAYGGQNLDQILMGAGIGAVEAAFGAERILTGLLRKGAVKPSTLPAAARIPTAAATEAVPEMAQAAQEQVAQNIALQREGYDVPTMRGVAGQAALEGLAGAGLGAITGAVQRREAPTPEAPAPVAEQEKPAPVAEGEPEVVAPEPVSIPEEEVTRRLEEAAKEGEKVKLETKDETQRRLEEAAQQGEEEKLRKQDEARQVVLNRALANIEERGGIASPEEARVVEEANIGKPYDRIDDSLGRTLSTDERLTEATGILVGRVAETMPEAPIPPARTLEEIPTPERRVPSGLTQEEITRRLQQARGEVAPEPPVEAPTPPVSETPPEVTPPKVTPPREKQPPVTSYEQFLERLPEAPEVPAVREANDSGDFRQLVGALKQSQNPVIQRIGELGEKIANKTTLRKPGVIKEMRRAAGVYRHADDSIQMNPKYAGSEQVNAHETLHALVAKAQRAPTAKQKATVKKIELLYQHVKRELAKQGIKPRDMYGLKNQYEFVAEAMSDPQFQYTLMQIPYKGNQSAWSAFVQMVADLLGIDNTNALTEVMALTEKLSEMQPRRRKTTEAVIEAAEEKPKEYVETRGGTSRFHGTGKEIESLSSGYALTGDNRNIYGQGFYTTDALDISQGYAKKGGKDSRIYEVSHKPVKLFNMEAPLDERTEEIVRRSMGDLFPTENAETGKPLTNLREIYDEFRSESANEGLSRDDVQDVFDDIRYQLEQQGYRGFEHVGGLQTGKKPHSVKIFWEPEADVSIKPADLTKYEKAPVEEREKPLFSVRSDRTYRGQVGKETPPTPTTAGQAALNTINQLGMGVKAPEEGRIDKVKAKLKQIGEAPVKDTAKEWKQTASDFLAKIDGSLFSADAPFENKLRQGFREDFKNIKDFVGALLKVSQSQAVAADAVSTRGMLIGKVEYREDLFKWVAVEDQANEINKARILDGIAKKYGLTKEEAVQVAHTYLSAANYEGILKRNAANKERIKELRAEGNTDEANRLSAAIVYVSPKQAAMVEPGLAIADQIPEVKEITTLWNKQRENVKNTMVETGLWTPEYADAMMDNAAYVPFYREMEEEADANPEMMIRGLQVKAKEHKLKGSEAAVADVFENMARWQQYAINRAIRNHKALQMIDAAQEMNMGDTTMARKVGEAERGKNVVRVWRDGKQEFYEMADPLFMDAFKSLGAVSIPTIKYFTKIANMLRESIVLYPMFSLGQVPQDAVAAIFASGLQPKFAFKIPYLAVKEFIKTMHGSSKIHEELRDFGAVGVRDFNAAVSREDAEITAGIKAPRGVMGKTKYVLERIAMSADNAVRQAVYEASMQQPGITKAEALEKAFEIINFRRRGSSKMVNLIGQTVPFFYAYLSAQRVAYKTITGVGISPTERKAALETLAYTSAAVMALSFIYAMANGDDEDYERTPSNVRDRSIVIPGTGGLRIPLRPDFFLFPKIIAEHTYHLMADNGFSDPAKFKKAMRDNFANAAFSPNVVPQIIKPTLEIAINYDFFQGKPIIGFFEQNKEASRQFSDSTSEFAKWMGGAGLSPQKVDHFVRGYFGTVGGLFLWGTNFFIEGEPGVPRPELSVSDMVATMPGVGAFKQKSTENALKVDFYELRDAIEKAKNTYDDMKIRSPEGLQTFLEDEKNLAKLSMEKGVTKIADHLSKIRRAIQQIAAAPEDRMSASEKEERIKELREVEMQMLKGINLKSLREQAKL